MHPSEALSPRDAFGSRAFAFVLDFFLVLVAAGPVAGAAGFGFALGFSLLYLGIVQGITGWSLAKAVLGIRVVRAGTVDPPGLVRGLLRWIAAPLGISAIGAPVAAFNERRRSLGDTVARTEVVGLAPAPRVRAWSVVAYVLLLSAFLAFSTFDTFLILWAIFMPMVVAGLVIVFGLGRMKGGLLWLAGLGFALVASSLMVFQGLCERGGGVCVESQATEALPAFVLLLVAIGVLFLLPGAARYAIVAVLVAIAEVLMFIRLRDIEDMGFAALLMLILLGLALVVEAVRFSRARAETRDRAAQAAT